jgi:uncharacterized protein YjlB
MLNRRDAIRTVAFAAGTWLGETGDAAARGPGGTGDRAPEEYWFPDDGRFPNNAKYPLLVYRKTGLTAGDPDGVNETFAKNNWTNSWVDGVYPFHHYHSTSHEVLGIYAGSALLQIGGPSGKQLRVSAGDILIIPAGVAHQCVQRDSEFGVVGAYPDGRHWDLLRGEPGERPKADQNTAALPLPELDPVFGAKGPLRQHWR